MEHRRVLPVLCSCNFLYLFIIGTIGTRYDNSNFLHYPERRGPTTHAIEALAGFICGYFVASFFTTTRKKALCVGIFALGTILMNIVRLNHGLGEHKPFEGQTLSPAILAALLWPVPWATIGGSLQWRLALSSGKAGRKEWCYRTIEGRLYSASSPTSRPLIALAFRIVAVAAWVCAAIEAVRAIRVFEDFEEVIDSAISGVALYLTGHAVWWVGRQWSGPSAERLLGGNKRQIVLYLRSFQDDGSRTLSDWPAMTIGALFYLLFSSVEQRFSKRLGTIGSFVAVGRPSETLPEIGAARMYLRDEDWQSVVKDLILRSRAVVIHAGPTPGLQWEMMTIRKEMRPEQVLLFVPSGVRRGKRRERDYQALREEAERALGCTLPRSIGNSSMLFFDPDGTWRARALESTKVIPKGHPLRGALKRLARDKYLRGETGWW